MGRGWLWPHVADERLETVAPFIAHADPSPAVIVVCRVAGIVASSLRLAPRSVFRGAIALIVRASGLAVRNQCRRDPGVTLTPTTTSVAAQQHVRWKQSIRSTETSTQPQSLAPRVRCSDPQHSQRSEGSASYVSRTPDDDASEVFRRTFPCETATRASAMRLSKQSLLQHKSFGAAVAATPPSPTPLGVWVIRTLSNDNKAAEARPDHDRHNHLNYTRNAKGHGIGGQAAWDSHRAREQAEMGVGA